MDIVEQIGNIVLDNFDEAGKNIPDLIHADDKSNDTTISIEFDKINDLPQSINTKLDDILDKINLIAYNCSKYEEFEKEFQVLNNGFEVSISTDKQIRHKFELQLYQMFTECEIENFGYIVQGQYDDIIIRVHDYMIFLQMLANFLKASEFENVYYVTYWRKKEGKF